MAAVYILFTKRFNYSNEEEKNAFQEGKQYATILAMIDDGTRITIVVAGMEKMCYDIGD